MPYPEQFVAPMREELTRFGVEELRTAGEVDQAVTQDGTTMIVVNSVCGCAAGKARPGIAMALLQNERKPQHVGTVFAGADIEATERAREHMAPYPPSSPSVAIFRAGKPVFMLHRHQIENRESHEIAQSLTEAFDEYCVRQTK